MQTLVVFIFISLSWMGYDSNAFSHGAPDIQCFFMTPKHGYQPQITEPPLTFFFPDSVSNVSLFREIRVNLFMKDGLFKGFLMRAEMEGVSKDDRKAIGTWKVNDSASQYLHCSGGHRNALTHTNVLFARKEVKATWTPPTNFSGTVVFRATVVQDYKTYWKNVISTPVDILSANARGARREESLSTETQKIEGAFPSPAERKRGGKSPSSNTSVQRSSLLTIPFAFCLLFK